jgi:hypothetical protein
VVVVVVPVDLDLDLDLDVDRDRDRDRDLDRDLDPDPTATKTATSSPPLPFPHPPRRSRRHAATDADLRSALRDGFEGLDGGIRAALLSDGRCHRARPVTQRLVVQRPFDDAP